MTRSRWPSAKSILFLMGCILSMLLPRTVAADTIVEFSVTGSFQEYSIFGPLLSFSPGSTITVDLTTGQITASSMTISSSGEQFSGTGYQIGGPPLCPFCFAFSGTLGDELEIADSIIPEASGGTIYVALATPPQQVVDATDFPVTLTPIPEPSSPILLGSGLIALAGFMRWKYLA